jgi:SAM-dependent methyltransferase
MSVNDPTLVAREYATSERLEARRTHRTAWLRFDVEAWDEALAAVAEARPHRVLDAGCGDGLFARVIAAPQVVGVDSSQAMVDRAHERGVDARVADIQNLPFEDDAFDVAVCNWVLYHLPDLDRGLSELARVARRFVGIYNQPGHLAELWSRVRPEFDASDDYHQALERHFAHVEERHTETQLMWEARDDLQRYLDAYVELMGPMTAPDGPYPFKATRLNCVYVATR